MLMFILTPACILASEAETAPAIDYPSIVRSHGLEAGFSQINVMLEGQDGYLWLGTFGGLVRFDGIKFTVFHATHENLALRNSMDQEGPSSDRIVALREDNAGRILIGTEDSGLSLYEHGRFRQLSICGGTCRIFALSPQVDNSIFATTNVGVFRIAMDSLRAIAIGGAASGNYVEIAVNRQNQIYVGGPKNGLGRVVGDDIVPIALPQDAELFKITAAGDFLWVASTTGFYRFDSSRGTWILKSVERNASPVESHDGLIWVSTLSGKLLRAEPSGELRTFGDLPEMHVRTLWRDHTGVVWIGGSEGLWSVQTSKAMLSRNVVSSVSGGGAGRAVVGDGKGGIWKGYSCSGIRHRLKDGTYEVVRVPVAEAPNCIVSLLLDAEGNLWAGTMGDGLRRVAEGKRETVPLSTGYSNLQIWQADNGDYWLAVERHTFRVYRTKSGKFMLSPPVAALEGLNVRKMAMARKGGIWFVGDHGVLRLDGERVVERWTPEQGLSSRFARAVYEDARGVLWIGTYGGGLNRIEDEKITHYDEKSGLFDDTVSCILADQAGQMWLAGNRGISVLPVSSQMGLKVETLPFAVSSGSVSFEFNGGTQSACHRDEKGHLWFALVRGFAEIDPTRLVEISSTQPRVHIERVVSRAAKHDPLRTVLLGASDELLEITYTAINLIDPEQVSFRYRMSGADSKWIDADKTRSVIFQNIPWGNHVFEVQARNRGGSWSTAAAIRISRPPPWYQRQWLWPLLGLLALLAVMWRTRESTSGISHEVLQRIAAHRARRQITVGAEDTSKGPSVVRS